MKMDEKFIVKKNESGFWEVVNKPSTDELRKHYEKLYKEFNDKTRIRKNYQESYNEQEIKHINLLNDLCLHSLYNYNPKWKNGTKTILEVGVGEGFFLKRAMDDGWDIRGIDFNLNGIEKFNPDLTEYVEVGDAFEILNQKKENEKFDVCIIQNVLEHVIDPKQLLLDLAMMLNDNGIIAVKVPNDYSPVQTRLMNLGLVDKEYWLVPPEHLNYFNTENFKQFMDDIQFEMVDMYATFPIDLFLFHEGSNYIKDPKQGKKAHRARTEIDLMLSESGIENFYRFYQSMASSKIGRNMTVLIKPKKDRSDKKNV